MNEDGRKSANDQGNIVPFPAPSSKSPSYLTSVVFAAMGSEGQVSVSIYGGNNEELADLVTLLARELRDRIQNGK